MPRAKRGFAAIGKMRSGRYQVRYTNPLTGARETAGRTFATKTAGEAWAADRRRQIDSGRRAAERPKPVTFAAYAAGWLEGRHVAGRPIKARTRQHYRDILDDHLLPAFGNRALAGIRPADVRDWHASTLVDKPTMRSHAYSLLRSIFASAVNDELIDANPCRIVGAGRTNRVVKIKPASIDELAVLTAAMPERLQLMVLLASWCALRFGETIELRRGDVDLSAEVIRVRRAAVRVGGTFQISTPKSEASIRDVDIPPHIIPIIEDHLAKHVGKGRDSLLFPAGATNGAGGTNVPGEENSSRHLQPSTLMRHWYKARQAAGCPDLRWHDLRHSGAVLAAATGASLAELMERLGHSTPAAAMRYQHAARGRGREIAALLSKLANT
jgi:integrase